MAAVAGGVEGRRVELPRARLALERRFGLVVVNEIDGQLAVAVGREQVAALAQQERRHPMVAARRRRMQRRPSVVVLWVGEGAIKSKKHTTQNTTRPHARVDAGALVKERGRALDVVFNGAEVQGRQPIERGGVGVHALVEPRRHLGAVALGGGIKKQRSVVEPQLGRRTPAVERRRVVQARKAFPLVVTEGHLLPSKKLAQRCKLRLPRDLGRLHW